MSRRNEIVVSAQFRGKKVEGIIAAGETPYPGQIVQMDPTVTLVGGRHTWKLYNRDADGDRPAGPHIVLDIDWGMGKTTSDAYAAGARAFGLIPYAGDELNVMYKNVSGTADDVVAGDLMIVDDTTGKLIVTTGGVESEPFMALENITDPTADQLLWVVCTGH